MFVSASVPVVETNAPGSIIALVLVIVGLAAGCFIIRSKFKAALTVFVTMLLGVLAILFVPSTISGDRTLDEVRVAYGVLFADPEDVTFSGDDERIRTSVGPVFSLKGDMYAEGFIESRNGLVSLEVYKVKGGASTTLVPLEQKD